MPYFDYFSLAEDEAQRVFEAFLAARPERVSVLRAELGEEVLDFSPASLVPAWEWFMRREAERRGSGRVDSAGGGLPSWYLPDPPELAPKRLAPATLCDVDVVGSYLAEVFLRNVEGAHWTIGKLPKRMKYAYQNTPVVNVGLDVDPIGIAYVNALREADGESDPEALLRTYEANLR